MKSWLCCIFGGGTPFYLVSAEDEKHAWDLIRNDLRSKGDYYWKISFNLENESGGLVELIGWMGETEGIVDLNDVYASNGTMMKGTFVGYKGLKD